MYLNVKHLFVRGDKIVGMECNSYDIDGTTPKLREAGLRFMSGLDFEVFIEDLALNNPNRRNNIIIINEPEFEATENIHYYRPTKALVVDPPIKVEDDLIITLVLNGKDRRLFFNSGTTIFRNIIKRVCDNAEVKVLDVHNPVRTEPPKKKRLD